MNKKTIITILLLIGAKLGFCQGYINFNFESANVAGYPPDSSSVPTTSAFPGWQAFIGGAQQTTVTYDAISLGGNLISIWDTNSAGFNAIQGNYAAALFAGPAFSSSISQTALVPAGAKSLVFDMYLENGGVSVTLGGQSLNLTSIGSGTTPNYPYAIYDADISAFAGLDETLTFTSLAGGQPNGLILDNIQFSPSAVPEPSTLALSALGGLFLAWRNRQVFSRT